MVIQRNWRPVQQNNEQHIQNLTSSSEDSNSSCQINLITAKKYFPTSSSSSSSSSSSASSCSSQPSAAENVLSALKQRYSGRNQITYSNQTPLENAIKSLDLLRLNIQSIFDKEIESIIQKFIEMFFRPAIKNIKENLGDSLNINDDQLKKISLALLENSKSQYVKTESTQNGSTKNIVALKQIPIISPIMEIKQECDIKQEIDSSNDSQNLNAYTYKNVSLKRKELSDHFEISTMELKTENVQSTQPEQIQQIIHLPSIQPMHQQNSTHQQQITQATQYQIPPQKKFILPLTVEAFQSPILTKQLMQDTTAPSIPQTIQTFQNASHLTLSRPAQIKPIIWNTSIVNSETQFILDIKATRLFGLNETKERLSTKHPELIRYMMDNQDKDWMIQQKIIQPHAKNQKYLILVKDELIKLTDGNLDYKINLNKNLNEFHGFKVSDFILKKIQRFFNELNFKSRFNFYDYSNFIPLITTPTHSSAAVSSMSTIQTTNLQSSTTPTLQSGCSTIMITSSTMSTMSQQGINTGMSTIPLSTSMLSSNFSNLNNSSLHFNTNQNNNNNNMNNNNNHNNNNNNNNNSITNSINSAICNMNNTALNSLKSRSTLSSTHATLTALLSNHNDGSIENE